MFTGIIEEIGVVKNIKKGAKSIELTVLASIVLNDTKIGDSISTNGVCLTVTQMSSHDFTVDIMDETLKRSNMQHLKPQSKVNLERALTLQSRLGGHMVSGHIDGIGQILAVTKIDIASVLKIGVPQALLKYIIKKGSIAVDGISLTVVDVDHYSFQVSIIPYTKEETTLIGKKVGDVLNIECDLIGKYVEKLLIANDHKKTITPEMLKEYGY